MGYRAALIGCGKIASEFADDPRLKGVYTHAGAYAACPATDLVAVCDVDPDKAENCARRWGVGAVYRDAAQLLADSAPEVVSICTPDHTHFEMLSLVLEAPGVRAVLAEKPLALEPGGARQIARRAEERGICVVVNYSRRYSSGHVHLRDEIHAGRLGDIQVVNGYYTKGTLHNGSHWFDLARFLVGEITAVWATDRLKETGSDPTLDVFVRFAGGASGFLHALDAAKYSLFEMDIVGAEGRVKIVDSGYWFDFSQVSESPYFSGYRTLVEAGREAGMLDDVTLHAVEDLVACVESGTTPRCSLEDGVKALEIGFAARASALSGQLVELP